MATSIIKQTMNESNSSYCKMPDGTLIQWGVLSLVTAEVTAVTFPIPFISNPSVVASTGAGAGRGYADTEDVTTTGFTLWKSTSVSQWARWIAIGRWK